MAYPSEIYQEHFLTRLWKSIRSIRKNKINVYFVSGMCYNCKAFDKLILPYGYHKVYLEWTIPRKYESLKEYASEMARKIDTRHPFILVGYSFGGVIVQEMAKIITPRKIILISTFKSLKEAPAIFRFARATNIIEKVPDSFFTSSDFMTSVFNKLVYDLPNEELAKYMTVTDPTYIRWAARQIVNWLPDGHPIPHLYHIQGTKDQLFPFDKMDNIIPVPGGDHLMILKHAREISRIIDYILMKKE